MIKTIILSLLILHATLSANEIFGIIKKITGIVESGDKLLIIKDKVYIGNIITTKQNSKVMIYQSNGNVITMGQNSKLELLKEKEVATKIGSVYFDIARKISKDLTKFKFKIKLKSASIGIRGTNFIITAKDNDENVMLRKGNLNILANKGDFSLYETKEKDEFNAYKAEFDKYSNDFNAEFNKYKEEDKYKFNGFLKEFNLEENTMLTFSKDNKVYKNKLTKKAIKNKFDSFDDFSYSTN